MFNILTGFITPCKKITGQSWSAFIHGKIRAVFVILTFSMLLTDSVTLALNFPVCEARPKLSGVGFEVHMAFKTMFLISDSKLPLCGS